MKRTLIATSLGAVLLTNASIALAEDYEEAVSYQQEWQGMGIGALIGAIAAGPPGLVIGAAGGALIGRHDGLESDLEASLQELKGLERQVAEQELEMLSQAQRLREQQVLSVQQLKDQQAVSEQQLQAITQGYLLNIHFRTEGAELEPRFVQQLNRVVVLLQRLPELNVHIDAYADRRGTDSYNQDLAQRRAQVVARRLQAAGVDEGRIREVSHGEGRAEYPLSDAEGMDFDRRVLLYFCRRSS